MTKDELRQLRKVLLEAVIIIDGEIGPVVVEYGCHCELDPGQKPDGCVLDEGHPKQYDCVEAVFLLHCNQGKEQCKYWKPVDYKGDFE